VPHGWKSNLLAVPLGAWPREVCVAALTLSSDAAFTNASNTLNDWAALQLASKHEKRPVGHDSWVHFSLSSHTTAHLSIMRIQKKLSH